MKMMDICESAVSGAEMGMEDKSDSMSEETETNCDEVESKEEASSEILNVDEIVVNREVMCTDLKPYAPVSSSEGFYPVILKLDHVSGLEGKPLGEMGVRHPNAHEVIDERPDPFLSTGSSAHQVLGVTPEHRPVVAAVTDYDLAQSVVDGNKESQAGVAVQSSNAVKLLHSGDIPGARATYQLVHTEISPGLLEATIKHANTEHLLVRLLKQAVENSSNKLPVGDIENLEHVCSVYEQAIAIEKGKEHSQTLSSLFAQYSQFLLLELQEEDELLLQ
ncbi:hypothetical protein U1Q18_010137 [Sarracenia purpurea var. burkii]